MISIYTIPNCTGCQYVIDLSERFKVPYEVITMTSESDVDKLRRRINRSQNIRVPIMVDENNAVIGYPDDYRRWLEHNYK